MFRKKNRGNRSRILGENERACGTMCVPNKAERYVDFNEYICYMIYIILGHMKYVYLWNVCDLCDFVTHVILSSVKNYFTRLFLLRKDQKQVVERCKLSRLLGSSQN